MSRDVLPYFPFRVRCRWHFCKIAQPQYGDLKLPEVKSVRGAIPLHCTVFVPGLPRRHCLEDISPSIAPSIPLHICSCESLYLCAFLQLASETISASRSLNIRKKFSKFPRSETSVVRCPSYKVVSGSRNCDRRLFRRHPAIIPKGR